MFLFNNKDGTRSQRDILGNNSYTSENLIT